MRNIFDQYTQPENCLTHALVSCLASDRALLRKFVRWTTSSSIPSLRRLEIIEQRLPGEEESLDESETEKRSLPDACIYYRDEWVLLIESKIESHLKRDQLERHRKVARRRGFSISNTYLTALVTKRPQRQPLDGTKIIEWSELYSWLRRERKSAWARRLTEYMEILEGKLVAKGYLKEGTLTEFSGIPFENDYPYNYLEAKRVLKLAMEKLRNRKDLHRKLGMDPKGKGRPAITGQDGTSVWDFLPLIQASGKASFTNWPHLTLSVERNQISASVIVPNGVKREYRRNLLRDGKEGFFYLVEQFQGNLERSFRRVDGVTPWMQIVQRHFPSRHSSHIEDARLQFDLRTAFQKPKGARKEVKTQPQWLNAVYEVLSSKRSNLQLTVGAIFLYSRCKAVSTPEILDHVANVWLACRPLIRAVVPEARET